MHLYELSGQYQALMQLNEDDESQIDNLSELLSNVTDQFNEKAENVGKVILSLNAESQAIKNEESRLSKRRNQLERKVEWLKSYLLNEMTITKIDKIEGQTLTLSLRNNPPSVKVDNEENIPIDFRKIIPETWQPDKTAILQHFKSTGEIINGVSIITDKKSLSIR